jgi:hypothetical protein
MAKFTLKRLEPAAECLQHERAELVVEQRASVHPYCYIEKEASHFMAHLPYLYMAHLPYASI